MQWSENERDGILILNISGEIDMQHSPALRKILQEKIRARCPLLLVDFSGVEYIDSSGLATLVEYRRDSREYGGELALAALGERVRTIFELVRLNEIIPIHPTLDDARMALQPKP